MTHEKKHKIPHHHIIDFGVFDQGGFGPDGDPSVDIVGVGNETMRWTMAYIALAELMGCWVAVEQPSSSTMFNHPTVQTTILWVNQSRAIWLIQKLIIVYSSVSMTTNSRR